MSSEASPNTAATASPADGTKPSPSPIEMIAAEWAFMRRQYNEFAADNDFDASDVFPCSDGHDLLTRSDTLAEVLPCFEVTSVRDAALVAMIAREVTIPDNDDFDPRWHPLANYLGQAAGLTVYDLFQLTSPIDGQSDRSVIGDLAIALKAVHADADQTQEMVLSKARKITLLEWAIAGSKCMNARDAAIVAAILAQRSIAAKVDESLIRLLSHTLADWTQRSGVIGAAFASCPSLSLLETYRDAEPAEPASQVETWRSEIDRHKAGSNDLVGFEMGHFIEFFFEDAVAVSKTLGIALSKRHVASDDKRLRVPMCGITPNRLDDLRERFADRQVLVVPKNFEEAEAA